MFNTIVVVAECNLSAIIVPLVVVIDPAVFNTPELDKDISSDPL